MSPWEQEILNLGVVGLNPTLGALLCFPDSQEKSLDNFGKNKFFII